MKNKKKGKIEFKKRNRQSTEESLIQVAGDLFRKYGYSNLTVSKIARQAEVDRNLVYRYFGNVAELFKKYLFGQDFWISHSDKVDEMIEENRHDDGKSLAKSLLASQLNYFMENKEMQRLIHWEITETNPIARGISDERERMGEQMLCITDNHFVGSDVDFRAIESILIAGVYYIVLHAKMNGSTFCGIDVNTEEDLLKIEKALKQIIDWAYANASVKLSDN